MAITHGLEPPQPIMCSDPESESGDSEYMFQSGSKYYLWNPIEGAIWEIVTSMDPGGHHKGDRQAETRIAEACEGRSGVFQLILVGK